MVTLAALHIASVAAMVAIKPFVSTNPSASLTAAIVFVLPLGYWQLAHAAGRCLALRQDRTHVLVRPRHDLHAHDFADPTGGGGSGANRGLHRRHVPHNARGYQAPA